MPRKGQSFFIVKAHINRGDDPNPTLKWREATLAFVTSKISPKEWLQRTAGLGETYHLLTTPKTPSLRSLTQPPPEINTRSPRAVFAETLLIYWPGKPCFYATDVWRTSYFPEDKAYESWILAMNVYLPTTRSS